MACPIQKGGKEYDKDQLVHRKISSCLAFWILRIVEKVVKEDTS